MFKSKNARPNKLELTRTTLRHLTGPQLSAVVGGKLPQTADSSNGVMPNGDLCFTGTWSPMLSNSDACDH